MSDTATRRRGDTATRESGFALLLVFLMAAMIAISLYLQLPRVAFESQRNKEQLLVERGEQYKRAIQLFVKKFNRYPGKIEELENTNNIRFLRRRYKDPMTGKEEWRLIHAGPGGILTDSVNSKGKPGEKKDENRNTFIGEAAIIGAVATTSQNPSAALRRRPSEGGGMPGMPGQPGATPEPVSTIPNLPYLAPTQPNQPGQQPGQPGARMPGQPGMAYPAGQPFPGQPGQPGQPGGIPGQPGVPMPIPGQVVPPSARQPYPQGQPYPGGAPPSMGGQPYIGGGSYPQSGTPSSAYPGAPVNSQTGGVSATPYSTQPGAQGAPPPFGQPGLNPANPGQNEATRLIQQILTNPRPGGMPTAGAVGGGGMQIGGGIAGVASTLEQDSIMIYEEHQKYNEWEFIYDPAKDRGNAGMMNTAGPGTPADQLNKKSSSPSQSQGPGIFNSGGGFGPPTTPPPSPPR